MNWLCYRATMRTAICLRGWRSFRGQWGQASIANSYLAPGQKRKKSGWWDTTFGCLFCVLSCLVVLLDNCILLASIINDSFHKLFDCVADTFSWFHPRPFSWFHPKPFSWFHPRPFYIVDCRLSIVCIFRHAMFFGWIHYFLEDGGRICIYLSKNMYSNINKNRKCKLLIYSANNSYTNMLVEDAVALVM